MTKKKDLSRNIALMGCKEHLPLIADIRGLIESARVRVAGAVNCELTMLYWRIGKRIREDILQEKRADYGEEIVATLSQQLSWSHIVAILPIADPLAREFYAQICRLERWSVRALRAKIDSMLFERTALSKKPEELARLELAKLQEEDKLTPDLIFRDPYFLDFLGLKGAYQEKDLETAILRK